MYVYSSVNDTCEICILHVHRNIVLYSINGYNLVFRYQLEQIL